MYNQAVTKREVEELIKNGEKLPFAIDNYPSRGQTAVQELYQTSIGKLFLKRVSERNHEECQIDVESGTLAEREFWAYRIALRIGLRVPALWLIDKFTTVQIWLDYPDGRTFKKSTGRMEFRAINIFECVVFDWVTGQVDRHDANYLYDYINKVVIPVDSGHAFLRHEGGLSDYLHLFEISEPRHLNRKITSGVKNAIDGISNTQLKEIIALKGADEFNALAKRKEALAKVKSLKDILDLYRGKK